MLCSNVTKPDCSSVRVMLCSNVTFQSECNVTFHHLAKMFFEVHTVRFLGHTVRFFPILFLYCSDPCVQNSFVASDALRLQIVLFFAYAMFLFYI